MDAVLTVMPKPSELVLAGVAPAPVVAVKKGCCSCFQSDTFSRSSQIISVAVAVGALVAIILMSLNIAPTSTGVYAFCAVLLILSTRLAFLEQRNIELGGYAQQNALYLRNNLQMSRSLDLLAAKVDELDPIAKSLAATNTALKSEVDRVTAAAANLEASLQRSRDLNDAQVAQIRDLGFSLERLGDENTKLGTAVRKYEELLGTFEAAITKHSADLAHRIADLDASEDRLEGVSTKFQDLLTAHTDLIARQNHQIESLKKMQDVLSKSFEEFSDGLAVRDKYVAKELELQAVQGQLVEKQRIFTQEQGRLVDDFRGQLKNLERILKARCLTLAKMVIPKTTLLLRLDALSQYVSLHNHELWVLANEDGLRKRAEVFARLREDAVVAISPK